MLAEWRSLQPKNFNILALPKRREWPQCHKESSWHKRGRHLCQKGKKLSHLTSATDREMGKSQGERESHLGERKGNQSGSIERKIWTPQWKKIGSKEKKERMQRELR